MISKRGSHAGESAISTPKVKPNCSGHKTGTSTATATSNAFFIPSPSAKVPPTAGGDARALPYFFSCC